MKLPIDVESIAQEFGVASIEPKKMSADGYLGKARDGRLVIRHRDDVSRARARFTVAHEIGHIILARVQGMDVTDASFRNAGGSNAEEVAVNRIAAELLMPESLLLDQLRDRQGSWDLVWQMRERFGVSTMALIWRILEIHGVPAVFVRTMVPDSKNKLTCRCRTSEKPEILFRQRVANDAPRFLLDAENDHPTKLSVFVANMELQIPMANRVFRSQHQQECWSIGWSFVG